MEPRLEDHVHHIIQLAGAALAASDPEAAVRRHLRRDGQQLSVAGYSYDLNRGRTFLVAVGKAAVPMALAAARLLADTLTEGVLVTKDTGRDWQAELADLVLGDRPSIVSLYHGGHPISNADSVAAAHAVIDLLSKTRSEDLVLFLISGGASAILCDPMIPLDEWQQLNEALLSVGCNITEINCVRRQLDRVKGGGLARHAAPAACCSLILSDVIGNSIDIIGSGPTVLHQDTPAEAIAIMTQYGLDQRLGPDIWSHILNALGSETVVSEVAPDISFHAVIGDVRQAAEAALLRAAQMGFLSQILTTRLQGEAGEVAHVIASIAQDLPPGRCLILGGETTVTLRGRGRGGRNQEMALATAIDIDGCSNLVVACLATDGEDGPTDAAGALVTGNTVTQARRAGLSAADFLNRNDSHSFFCQLDELNRQVLPDSQDGVDTQMWANHLIRTGPTGTNVNDLVFIFSYRASENRESDPDSPPNLSNIQPITDREEHI